LNHVQFHAVDVHEKWNSYLLSIKAVFTALHEMRTRSSNENSIRLSVCLSVCLCLSVYHTRGLWQNGRKICSDFYRTRKIIQPSFL